MSNQFPNKVAAVIIGGAAGLQFIVSFCYIALCLLGYDYLTEKGYSFLQIVIGYAILTTFYRAMRTVALIYSPNPNQM
jgi:hypothetical protein